MSARQKRMLLGTKNRLALVAGLVVLLVAGLGAFAYFTSTGSGTAAASVGSLSAPTITSAAPGAGTVALTWTAITAPASGTVTYYVTRDGGAPAGDCPTSTSTASVLTCTDDGLTAGDYDYTVTAKWRSWSATSATTRVTVASAAADHLVLGASSTQTAGTANSLTITAKDASNNTVTSYAGSHDLTFGGASSIGAFDPSVTNSSGTAIPFGAPTALTFTNGVATVSLGANGAMTLYKVELATIVATDGSIGNTGLNVTVSAAAAAQIVLSGSSGNLASGSTRTLTATIEDTYGNTVTAGGDSSVNVNFAQSGGTGTVSGTGNAPASGGVATKTVTGALAGTAAIRASATLSAPAGATDSNTITFTVTFGAATQIALTGSDSNLASATTRTFTATIMDAAGNTVTAGGDSSVNVNFAQSGGTGTVSGTGSAPASGGVATKTVTGALAGTADIQASATLSAPAGATDSNTISFTVTFGAATQIVLSGSTADLASAATRTLTATVEDAAGNTVISGADSSVSVSFAKTTGAGTLTGLGSALASGGVATKVVTGVLAGSVTVQASATLSAPAGATTSNALTFNVVAGAATQIVLSGSTADLASSTTRAFAATIKDAAGNTVDSGADSGVSVSFAKTTGAGSLGGTGTATASGGVATKTVTGVLAGSVTVQASATLSAPAGVTSSNTLTFNVIPGVATKLEFTQQPTSAGAAATIAPVKVSVEDANGNVETTDSTTSVTLAIGTNPNGGTLTGTVTQSVVSGVATFSGLSINNAGTGYTLTASSSGLTGDTSSSFDITAGKPIWIATGTTATAATNVANNLAPPLPNPSGGLQNGDFLLLYVANSNGTNVAAVPPGWTLLTTNGFNNMTLSVFYDFYRSGDSAPSLTINAKGDHPASSKIVAYRYVNTTTPLDTASVNSTSAIATTFTPTGLTTVTAGARAVSLVAEDDAIATAPTLGVATAQGFTVETGFPDAPALGSDNRHAVDLTSKGIATAGAVTFPTYNTNATGVWAAVSLALRPVVAPTVTAVSPAFGPAAGGTSVTISGTGLLGVMSVKFGGTAASTFTINSDSSITATAPAQSAGTVDVTVSTLGGGTSATSANDRFTYDTTPTVTSVSPIAGVATGGTIVTITGTGFLTTVATTGVKFGSTNATTFTVNSDTQITATAPAHAPGPVDVTVTNTSTPGTSATSANDQFTYDTTPTITSLSPASGVAAGGTGVTITGTGFLTTVATTGVKFGGTNATTFTVNSDTQITATAPAGSAGTVDVTVTNTTGTSALSVNDIFTYTPLAAPTVTSVSPSSGVASGGTSVTITGTNFTAGSTVNFGASAATGVTVNSSTSITATSPAGSGTVNVTVTTSGGTSATGAANQFIYIPAVTALGTPSTVIAGTTASFTTNTYGPTASGSVVLVLVTAHENVTGASATLSVSGGPTTGAFTQIGTKVAQSGAGDSSIVAAFWALGAGGAATGSFTVTGPAGKVIDTAVVQVVQVTGANTTTPIAATATPGAASNTSASVSFPAPSSGDAQILVVGVGKGTAVTVSPPAGFTELQDTTASNGGNTVNLEASVTSSPVTGPATATLSAADTWATLGIELKHG
jgi:hypothetical protein